MFRRLLCTCALASLMAFALLLAAGGQQTGKSSSSAAQPDKALYDHGVDAIRHKRFEIGRMALQTLISTYQSSEYLPKAQLAIAESWFQQGGARGSEQARAACDQLIQQFPESPEAKQAAELLRKIQEATKERSRPREP